MFLNKKYKWKRKRNWRNRMVRQRKEKH